MEKLCRYKNSYFLDHLFLHLELHVQASQCGELPSSMSGSAPAYIHVTEGSDFFLFFKKIISLQYKFAVKKCSSSQ